MERTIKILKRLTQLLLIFALFSVGYFFVFKGDLSRGVKDIVNFSLYCLIFVGIVEFLLGLILKFLSYKNKEKTSLSAYGFLIIIIALFVFALINTTLCCSAVPTESSF